MASNIRSANCGTDLEQIRNQFFLMQQNLRALMNNDPKGDAEKLEDDLNSTSVCAYNLDKHMLSILEQKETGFENRLSH